MRSDAYKRYLLVLLTVVAAANFMDRVALGIVLQDIKVDLDLTDTQLGLLTGIAFALFYSVMGIPLARWADRGNRVAIISLTALLWSVAVAACGFAHSFVQLLAIRVAVAVGEAGCMPPALSLMADYFTRAERPRAAAVYYGWAAALAGVVGYFLTGWLNELYGWRVTFMLLGAPGVVLAALAWFTLKEPRRAPRIKATAPAVESPSLKEVCVTLWGSVTFRHLLLCLSVFFLFTWGIGPWLPTFFIRSYGLSSGEIGTWLAAVSGGASLIGTYLGGELATRYAANNERLQLIGMAIAVSVSGVPLVFAFLSPTPHASFGWIALYVIGVTTLNGPLISAMQTVVPERMRAMAFAIAFLIANLIGMGLGPLAAGMLSDALRPWAADESLRYALLMLTPGFIWVAWHAWRASQTVTRDLSALPRDPTPLPTAIGFQSGGPSSR